MILNRTLNLESYAFFFRISLPKRFTSPPRNFRRECYVSPPQPHYLVLVLLIPSLYCQRCQGQHLPGLQSTCLPSLHPCTVLCFLSFASQRLYRDIFQSASKPWQSTESQAPYGRKGFTNPSCLPSPGNSFQNIAWQLRLPKSSFRILETLSSVLLLATSPPSKLYYSPPSILSPLCFSQKGTHSFTQIHSLYFWHLFSEIPT